MTSAIDKVFMQISEWCQVCLRRHLVNSWYLFFPKIGPLRQGCNLRGTHCIKVSSIDPVDQDEIDEQLKGIGFQSVEYGVGGCPLCETFEFADIGHKLG